MGRPSTFSEALASEICERLATGEPLAEICRDEGMPHSSTFRRWCEAGHELGEETLSIAYARARDDGFDAIAADALRIANTPCEGEITTDDGEKVTVKKEDMLGHRKLQVDTRLKLLAKWDPRRYGDKQLLGSDPDNPLPPGYQVTLVKGSDA